MTPEEFRTARRALGLTQAQLSDILEYSGKSRICAMENGREEPGPRAVRLLRAYLDGWRPEDWPG